MTAIVLKASSLVRLSIRSYMRAAIARRRLSLIGTLHAVAALVFAITAVAQSTGPFYVTSIQTGLRPLGIDTMPRSTSFIADTDDVVVANSGENSVSLLTMSPAPYVGGPRALTITNKITGIPSPYAVAGCPASSQSQALATSPTDNSAWVL